MLFYFMLAQRASILLISTGIQGKESERLKVSVRTVVNRHSPSDTGTAQQANTMVRLLQGHLSFGLPVKCCVLVTSPMLGTVVGRSHIRSVRLEGHVVLIWSLAAASNGCLQFLDCTTLAAP